VVKNVAGYDLCKLFTGSRGTLGLITELTFRLRPRPEREATLAARADAAGPLLEGARALLAGEFLPAAVELLSPRAASVLPHVGSSSRFALVVRFAGTAKAVESQLERARAALAPYAAQGACEIFGDDVRLWAGLAALPLGLPYPLRWRANVRPSALPGLIAKLDSLAALRGGALWHASLGAGRLRVLHEEVADLETCAAALSDVRAYSHDCGGALEVEGADEAVRRGLAGRGFDSRELPAANVELIGRVKHQLDPLGLFPAG
jgi:FAD/FMN-containing dehydrogenase